MITVFIFLSVSLFCSGQCNEISSIEVDRLEFSPLYTSIIFSDIAEILNDIDMNFKPDTQGNSGSESDDDEVENLLQEYQHYLDKAQKQRENYLEKFKGKNKVPSLRHEKFSKQFFPKIHSFDTNRSYMANNIQTQQKIFYNPYDLFIPMNFAPEQSIPTYNGIIWNEHKMSDFPLPKLKSDNGVLSPCYCENNKFPCKCKCKQCLIPLERTKTALFDPSKIFNLNKPSIDDSFKHFRYSNEYTEDSKNDNLNVRIKVDIQIPKIDNVLKKMHKNIHSYQNAQIDDANDTEAYTSTNISFPTVNFPIPLNIFTAGLSKLYQYGYSPIHKISLHKKKKTLSKKNRGKYLPFHHVKGNFYEPTTKTEKYGKYDQTFDSTPQWTQLKITSNVTEALGANSTTNVLSDLSKQNNSFSSVPIFINISSDDNSIDTETTSQVNINYTSWDLNKTTEAPQPMRIKRDNTAAKNSQTASNDFLLTVEGLNTSIVKKIENNDQQSLLDSDLLYWPTNDESNLQNIRDTHTQSAKIQLISHEIPKVSNATNIAEKMLNKINWENIDMVASTFVTVVGKYANGVITFCSNTICRSLKCTDKNCVQRSCVPENRFRQRGHCKELSKDTETLLSEELGSASSNVAYELIEALQNNMMGQMFGKATLCLDVKCITFEAINKHFSKNKCLKKELDSSGHCRNVKNFKTV